MLDTQSIRRFLMNMKRKRYGSHYYNCGEEVNEWCDRTREGSSSFIFCNQCYDRHGDALIMQLFEKVVKNHACHKKTYWFNHEDEPIGSLEKWDRPIYHEAFSDEDVIYYENNEPYECQKCDAPIREKKEGDFS